jgi:hypothetical protein
MMPARNMQKTLGKGYSLPRERLSLLTTVSRREVKR